MTARTMAPLSPKYSALKDDASSLLSDANDGAYHQQLGVNRQWTTRRWITILVALLLSTNTTSIFIASKVVRSSTRSHHKSVFEPPTGIPPFFSNISLELHAEHINSPFYDTDDSIYRKHNSPETEAAWRELTQLDAGFLLLPKDQAEQAEIDPKKHAYWNNPEKGLVGHPVRLEATHQLHCLNLIRRFSYFNYNYTLEYDGPLIAAVPVRNQILHLDHCVEFLRRRLMCTSDMGILPYIWLGNDGDVVGDMSRMYTCRDYESVRRFVKEKAEPADGRVKPKPGDFVLYDYI